MTNLEALKANVSQVYGIVISDNAFTKALLDEGITESETYTAANEEAVDKATIRIYKQVLGSGDLNEGDVSLRISQNIKAVIDNLLVKWGLSPEFGTKPTVKSISPW